MGYGHDGRLGYGSRGVRGFEPFARAQGRGTPRETPPSGGLGGRPLEMEGSPTRLRLGARPLEIPLSAIAWGRRPVPMRTGLRSWTTMWMVFRTLIKAELVRLWRRLLRRDEPASPYAHFRTRHEQGPEPPSGDPGP